MVFTSSALLIRIFPKPTPGPDPFWKRRKFLKLSAHFYGRRQNCFRLAIRSIMKALIYATNSRDLKPKMKNEVYVARLKAACEEHGFAYPFLKESLIRSNILLNKKVLSDLAIWEPRSFKCIVDYAWNKAKEEGIDGIEELGEPPSGVLLKPMEKK